jgi:hypothetical protein
MSVPQARPLVAIGMTLHNRAAYLPEAIESLLAQTWADFTLVLIDDGSTDDTDAVARSYERDPRVRYIRLPERRGMVAAWRAAFDAATSSGARYFAWASDHDRWAPRWLETLVEALEQDESVVLAYPLTQRIDADGRPLAKPAREFETWKVYDRDRRWSMLNRSDAVAAGDIVYGLMRTAAVREAGVFRDVLCPDRLLIAELTLQGQIRQVPEVLWFRRQFGTGSIERQRSTLFAPGTAVPSTFTPPWYMHARSMWASGNVAPGLIVRYAAAYAWRHYGKSSVQRGILSTLGWPRWIYKRVKHAALLALYHALVATRRWRGHA